MARIFLDAQSDAQRSGVGVFQRSMRSTFHLIDSGNAPSDDEQAEILERSAVLNGKSGRLIFANDQLLERDALPESLRRAGVIFNRSSER